MRKPKTLRQRMEDRCESIYCCPQMKTIVVDESIELFHEMMEKAIATHSVVKFDRLEELALKRVAEKHGAVKRVTPKVIAN